VYQTEFAYVRRRPLWFWPLVVLMVPLVPVGIEPAHVESVEVAQTGALPRSGAARCEGDSRIMGTRLSRRRIAGWSLLA